MSDHVASCCLQAVEVGSEAIAAMCSQMEEWAAAVGQPKRSDLMLPPSGLEDQVWGLVGRKLGEVRPAA